MRLVALILLAALCIPRPASAQRPWREYPSIERGWGRVVNLAVGDRFDGGRVASIGNGRLYYVKRGRTLSLEMPRS